MITKIISLVVASAFLFNSVAYGLGTMPGTTQPAVQDEMINMLRDGFLKKGPSALRDALSSETIHAEFSPSAEPAANGIKLLDGVPAGMESDPAFNAEDLAEAIEKVLPGDVVSVDNYRADNPGDFPVAKMSRDGDRKKWTVHEYMASAWANIKSRNVIFTYTYQDGHAEAFSLASLLLDEVTSLGKRPHDDGRTGIVRDAVRAWFVGSYCLSNETRYNNDKLEERVRWFCRDAKAAEMGFLKAFPYMAETDETLARGVELVRFINYHFYGPGSRSAESVSHQTQKRRNRRLGGGAGRTAPKERTPSRIGPESVFGSDQPMPLNLANSDQLHRPAGFGRHFMKDKDTPANFGTAGQDAPKVSAGRARIDYLNKTVTALIREDVTTTRQKKAAYIALWRATLKQADYKESALTDAAMLIKKRIQGREDMWAGVDTVFSGIILFNYMVFIQRGYSILSVVQLFALAYFSIDIGMYGIKIVQNNRRFRALSVYIAKAMEGLEAITPAIPPQPRPVGIMPDRLENVPVAEQAGADQSNATGTIPSEVKQKIASVMFTHVKYTPDWDESVHEQIAVSGLTAESFIASNPAEREKLITDACERYIELAVERVSKARKSDVLMVTEFANVREVIAGAQELLWEKFLEELTGDTAIIKMPRVFVQNEEMRRHLNELVRPAFYSIVAEAFKKSGLSMPSQEQPRDPATGRFETKLPGSPAMALLLFAYCGKLDDNITPKMHREMANDFSGFVNISDRTLRRDREALREAGYLIGIIDSDADHIESDASTVTYKLSASGKKTAKALLKRLSKKYGRDVRYAIFDEFSSGNEQVRKDIKEMDAKIKKTIAKEKLRTASAMLKKKKDSDGNTLTRLIKKPGSPENRVNELKRIIRLATQELVALAAESVLPTDGGDKSKAMNEKSGESALHSSTSGSSWVMPKTTLKRFRKGVVIKSRSGEIVVYFNASSPSLGVRVDAPAGVMAYLKEDYDNAVAKARIDKERASGSASFEFNSLSCNDTIVITEGDNVYSAKVANSNNLERTHYMVVLVPIYSHEDYDSWDMRQSKSAVSGKTTKPLAPKERTPSRPARPGDSEDLLSIATNHAQGGLSDLDPLSGHKRFMPDELRPRELRGGEGQKVEGEPVVGSNARNIQKQLDAAQKHAKKLLDDASAAQKEISRMQSEIFRIKKENHTIRGARSSTHNSDQISKMENQIKTLRDERTRSMTELGAVHANISKLQNILEVAQKQNASGSAVNPAPKEWTPSRPARPGDSEDLLSIATNHAQGGLSDLDPLSGHKRFMPDKDTPKGSIAAPAVPTTTTVSSVDDVDAAREVMESENAAIMKKRDAAMEEFKNYPFLTDINTVEFDLPIAPEIGPSSDTKDFRLSREQILNIWKTVNLAHEERVKILLLQDEVGPTGTAMDAALHDIRNRIRDAGGNDDTIDFELFQGEKNLETLLDLKDESSKRVKRIVLTTGSRSREMVSNLVDRRPELFKTARSLGIALPADYYDFKPNSKKRTFYQASMLLRGWNAAIIDNTKRTTAASILFTNMLEGCYDGDISVLLKQLVPVENETDKETKERINSCSNSAIRLLSQKTAAAIENLKLIMREFWTAA